MALIPRRTALPGKTIRVNGHGPLRPMPLLVFTRTSRTEISFRVIIRSWKFHSAFCRLLRLLEPRE